MGEICFQIFMILRLKSGVCALAYQSPGHFFGGAWCASEQSGTHFLASLGPQNLALESNPMYAMSPAEIDTENLARTCLYGRQLPRILHRPVRGFQAHGWAAASSQQSTLPPNTDPGNPMPMHLLRRFCRARPPVPTDDLEGTRVRGVLRSAGLNEAEPPSPAVPTGASRLFRPDHRDARDAQKACCIGTSALSP